MEYKNFKTFQLAILAKSPIYSLNDSQNIFLGFRSIFGAKYYIIRNLVNYWKFS